MMDLEFIRARNAQIAADSAERELIPFVPFDADEIDGWPPIPFPSLGSFEPDGWQKTDASWFVDKSGRGIEREPALSVEQFKRELRRYVAKNPGHGFAVTEEGSFQVVVWAFRRAS